MFVVRNVVSVTADCHVNCHVRIRTGNLAMVACAPQGSEERRQKQYTLIGCNLSCTESASRKEGNVVLTLWFLKI